MIQLIDSISCPYKRMIVLCKIQITILKNLDWDTSKEIKARKKLIKLFKKQI